MWNIFANKSKKMSAKEALAWMHRYTVNDEWTQKEGIKFFSLLARHPLYREILEDSLKYLCQYQNSHFYDVVKELKGIAAETNSPLVIDALHKSANGEYKTNAKTSIEEKYYITVILGNLVSSGQIHGKTMEAALAKITEIEGDSGLALRHIKNMHFNLKSMNTMAFQRPENQKAFKKAVLDLSKNLLTVKGIVKINYEDPDLKEALRYADDEILKSQGGKGTLLQKFKEIREQINNTDEAVQKKINTNYGELGL